MKQPRHKVAKTIADKTLSKGASQAYAKEVAAYLLAENRVGELESVLRDVQSDWAEAGFVEVIARSAHPLTSDVQDQIMHEAAALYPKAERISITQVEDPEVIGGVRLQLPGKQLDLTIETKLHKFKQLTVQGKE
jgi:F0F1-type ATP synthase delta subunit